MGVRQERVSAIERAEPGATEVRTLAGYVEALGGRLEILADFGGERTVLRESPVLRAVLSLCSITGLILIRATQFRIRAGFSRKMS